VNIVNNYCNPFSDHFRETVQDFHALSRTKKVAAIAAAVFGALLTPYLLCVGGVALFQLTVKWLKTGITGEVESKTIQVKDKTVSTENKIDRLSRMARIPVDKRELDAIAKGYAIVSENNNYTGKGFQRIGGNGSYEGDFVNGQWHGHGIYIYNWEGNIYDGEFSEGYLTGSGVSLDLTRSIFFEGNFVDCKFHGQGLVRYYRDKITVTCRFNEGCPEGRCTKKWDGQGKIEVSYTSGIRVGETTITLEDGNRYVGHFEVDINRPDLTFEGRGIHYHPDGQEEAGFFNYSHERF